MNHWPTPAQLLADKRAGNTVTIGLPRGRQIRLTTYLDGWKKLLTLPVHTSVPNWTWHPISAGEILRDISRGVHDRINQKLPWYRFLARPLNLRHVEHKLDDLYRRGLIHQQCQWCGQRLASRQPHHNRFCDASCRRSYYL